MSILGVVAVGVNWDTMANETNGGGTPGDAVHVDELGNSSYSPAIAAQAPIPTPPAVVFPQAPPLTILPVFRTTLFRSFTPHEWTHLPDGWNPDWASYAECSCVLGGLNYARLYAKPPGWTGLGTLLPPSLQLLQRLQQLLIEVARRAATVRCALT